MAELSKRQLYHKTTSTKGSIVPLGNQNRDTSRSSSGMSGGRLRNRDDQHRATPDVAVREDILHEIAGPANQSRVQCAATSVKKYKSPRSDVSGGTSSGQLRKWGSGEVQGRCRQQHTSPQADVQRRTQKNSWRHPNLTQRVAVESG